MGNYDFTVRARRWSKFLLNYLKERLRGLDFSMVYVGDLQKNTAEYHGYSMTDADDMKRILGAVPIIPSKSAFLDVGCGKGMCMKVAAELGYAKMEGLDLDERLLNIARKNMCKLQLNVGCIQANAADFDGYAAYDVFYFYNPFGKPVFEKVIQRLIESQNKRDRDIWAVYYHPVFGELFQQAGFTLEKEIHDHTRDTVARIYKLSEKGESEGEFYDHFS